MCVPMVLLPSYLAWVFSWKVFCGASRLVPEQKESTPPARQVRLGPMVILRSGAGLKMPDLVASLMLLRNLVKPKRMAWVNDPVLKSIPAACTGVLFALLKGWKLFGIKPLVLLFCSYENR